jgi:hypothetical protein
MRKGPQAHNRKKPISKGIKGRIIISFLKNTAMPSQGK